MNIVKKKKIDVQGRPEEQEHNDWKVARAVQTFLGKF